MASKLDQLTKAAPNRALKKINLDKLDEPKEVQKIESTKESTVEKPSVAKMVDNNIEETPVITPTPATNQVNRDELPAIKRTPNRTMLSEIGNTEEAPVIEEKEETSTVKEKEPAKTKTTKKKAANTETFTIRILEKDDQEFLKRGCRVCGYKSMQDFFIALVEEDSKVKTIDFRDEQHSYIFNSDKRFFTSTARITPELKDIIKAQAAKHRMYDGEYTAYLVHKKRMETDGWN